MQEAPAHEPAVAPAGKPTDASRRDQVFVFFQRCLPTRLLSTLIFHISRIHHEKIKHWLISIFIKRFPVNLEEAEFSRIENYDSFNHFFTRALKPEARKLSEDPRALMCPVDGTVSQIGRITDGRIFQAKGHEYTVRDLLNGDENMSRIYANGSFCTIYLAPFNYHRIHMPLTGRLRCYYYVPGRLFSVNAATARALPNLFTRNERLCTIFDSDAGPIGLVMVGALFVGSMETTWAGRITPPHHRGQGERYEPMSPVTIGAGVEMGRFNMGSTVILLAPPDSVEWHPKLQAGMSVKMGMRIGVWQPPEATMPIRKVPMPSRGKPA